MSKFKKEVKNSHIHIRVKDSLKEDMKRCYEKIGITETDFVVDAVQKEIERVEKDVK